MSTSPSSRTSNNSQYRIIGNDEGWVLGVEGQLNKILKSYENLFLSFLHQRNIYDFILWLAYVPCLLLSISNWAKKYPLIVDYFFSALQPVFFFVLFVLGLYLFRIFFNMTKRILPFASLKGDLKEPRDIWSYVRGIFYILVSTSLTAILSKIFV